MIGNLYRNTNSNNSSKRSLGSSSKNSKTNDFRSPFMYMHDDSNRTTFDLDDSVMNHTNGNNSDPSMMTQGGKLKARMASDHAGSTYVGLSDDDESDDDSGSDSDDSDSDDSDSSGSTFGNDFNIDVSTASSFMIGDDDDLDELEKALEQFAAKEEKQRNKESRLRSKQAKELKRAMAQPSPHVRTQELLTTKPAKPNQGPPRRTKSDVTDLHSTKSKKNEEAKRGNRRRSGGQLDHDSDNRSVGSNKSLPLSALYDPMPEPSNHSKKSAHQHSNSNKAKLSNSNRSLNSLCPVKDQLAAVFGDTKFMQSIHWDAYFEETDPGSIISEKLDRAIRSKKAHRLEQCARQGVNLNARNKQGESVVSLVCRAGNVEQLVYLMTVAKVSVRVRDHVGKTPLHEVAWSPTFEPAIALMLMTDSPELLWAPDKRGFLALDYAPKRCQGDWYEFLETKQPVLRLALQFSRFKESSKELNRNQERLCSILKQKLHLPKE